MNTRNGIYIFYALCCDSGVCYAAMHLSQVSVGRSERVEILHSAPALKTVLD